MIRAFTYAVVLTLLISPFLNAEAHRRVLDQEIPIELSLEQDRATSGQNPNAAGSLWHATFHCVSHMVAHIEHLIVAGSGNWLVDRALPVNTNELNGGREVAPPIPPPVI